QVTRRVELPPTNQEIRGLEAVTAAGCWIDAKVGEQAILGRSCWQHRGPKALQSGAMNRFMRRINKDPGVAVKHHADLEPFPHKEENALDHFLVRDQKMLVWPIEGLK